MATELSTKTTEASTALHGQWSSRMVFILAATGSAVGLGNIWKFPYITGENGGGAFVLVYLLCVAAIGIPIMMGEVLIGRKGRKSPINSMKVLADAEGKSRGWVVLGWCGVLGAFIILSFYSVIGGWATTYVGYSLSGSFSGASAESVGATFTGLLGSPWKLTLYHTVFMGITTLVVARGLRNGLEKAVKFLMPALFALLLILVGYAMTTGYFGAGLAFLFTPDFSKLTTAGILTAMGHAFFTLSLGMGIMITYGSYLPENVSIAKTSIIVSLMDTVVALLAGMAIFPLVFANGMEPGSGPGLIFQTLPVAFGQIPGGSFFCTLFFILLVFAALTSSISLQEPAVEWLEEHRGIDRKFSALAIGGAIWLLGLVSVLSFNVWSDVAPLGMFEAFAGKTPFDLLDYLTASIMLPISGLLVALFTGWAMTKESSREALNMPDGPGYNIWRLLVRYVAPIGVAIVFVYNLG
jgi:NSS family neurotransmitter:Na+ symporter